VNLPVFEFSPDLSGRPDLKEKHLEIWWEPASGGGKAERRIIPIGSDASATFHDHKPGPGEWVLKVALWVEGPDGNTFVFDTQSVPFVQPA